MASFRLINNTASVLPLSDSSFVPPSSERTVSQITLEMRRLEVNKLLTIIQIPDVNASDALLPDYVGTTDPNAGNNNGGGGSGTGSNDLASLTPAPDGSIPEYATVDNLWHATTAPRQLLLDGGNF